MGDACRRARDVRPARTAGGLPRRHRRGRTGWSTVAQAAEQDPAQPATWCSLRKPRSSSDFALDLGPVHDRTPAPWGRVRKRITSFISSSSRYAISPPATLLHTRRPSVVSGARRQGGRGHHRRRHRLGISIGGALPALRAIPRRLPATDRHRRLDCDDACRRPALRRTRAVPRTPPFATAHRRRRRRPRGPQRAEPAARATGDAGRAGRLRGRRPGRLRGRRHAGAFVLGTLPRLIMSSSRAAADLLLVDILAAPRNLLDGVGEPASRRNFLQIRAQGILIRTRLVALAPGGSLHDDLRRPGGGRRRPAPGSIMLRLRCPRR